MDAPLASRVSCSWSVALGQRLATLKMRHGLRYMVPSLLVLYSVHSTTISNSWQRLALVCTSDGHSVFHIPQLTDHLQAPIQLRNQTSPSLHRTSPERLRPSPSIWCGRPGAPRTMAHTSDARPKCHTPRRERTPAMRSCNQVDALALNAAACGEGQPRDWFWFSCKRRHARYTQLQSSHFYTM